ARQARRQPRLRHPRDADLRRRPHRPRARCLARRPQRLERPDRRRRPRRRSRPPPALGADRESRQGADARPRHLPQPPVRRRVGLALMTTLEVRTPYWQSTLWLTIVGVGSGMFNSPNTAAMMGTVPAQRRGIAAGARMLLQNTGAVLSIAFVLAIVTSAVPKA